MPMSARPSPTSTPTSRSKKNPPPSSPPPPSNPAATSRQTRSWRSSRACDFQRIRVRPTLTPSRQETSKKVRDRILRNQLDLTIRVAVAHDHARDYSANLQKDHLGRTTHTRHRWHLHQPERAAPQVQENPKRGTSDNDSSGNHFKRKPGLNRQPILLRRRGHRIELIRLVQLAEPSAFTAQDSPAQKLRRQTSGRYHRETQAAHGV